MRDNPVAGHVPRHPRPRRPARRRRPRDAPRRARRRPRAPAQRSRRSIPAASRPPSASSATSSSTTSGDRSSTPTSCASGSGARWRSTPSATACSCCSPATTRRWPSGSTAIAGRLEAVPRHPRRGPDAVVGAPGPAVAADRDRDGGRAARVLRRDRSPPDGACSGRREQRRLERAAGAAKVAVELYGDVARGHPRERHRRLVDRPRAPRRAGRAPRVRRARCRRRSSSSAGRSSPRSAPRAPQPRARSTPTPTRWRSSTGSRPTTPPTFEGALEAYRDAMLRARSHLIDRDLVTIPDDERIEVIETPEYLRNVIPFAAYFSPAAFDTRREGHLRRHAVGATATRTRCASTTGPRSATPASTRRTRAITCSSTSPVAIRR